MRTPTLLLCLAALGLFAFSCTPRPDFSQERLSDKIKLSAADWPNMVASTPLDPQAINSWIPESGIRGRYQVAKKVLGKATIESIVGEKAFLSGPHANGVNYRSLKEFGRYNPKFLQKLRSLLADVFANKILVAYAQDLYDRELQQYLRTFYLAYDAGANNQGVMDGYLSAIAQDTRTSPEQDYASGASYYLQEAFRDFANSMEEEGYDVYEGFTCPGFWVRRSIDGTADEFYALLTLTMETFDGAFLESYGGE